MTLSTRGSRLLDVVVTETTNAVLGLTNSVSLAFLDDEEPPTVDFQQASVSVTEAAGALQLDLQLSAVSGLDVTVPLSLVEGTATTADAQLVSDEVLIPAGSTTASVELR